MNFFRRYQKPIIVLGFLILVLLIGYLLWRLFFQPSNITPIEVTVPETGAGLPVAGPGTATTNQATGTGLLPGISGEDVSSGPSPVATGGATKTTTLTQDQITSPTLTGDGQVQYYNRGDGRFYRIDQNGQAIAMSDKVFYNVKDAVWAPDKNRAILEYPDGNKILYNFQTKEQVTLPAHWEDFSFSPDSGRVVAKSLGLDPENRWLITANDDGSQAQTLENIGTNDKTVFPDWSPNKQIVAMYTQGLDFNRQEVFFVGQNGENFKSTIIEGRGFQPQWSQTGDRLLYSVYSTDTNLNPKLWIVDASGDAIGQNRRSIDLNTWADKCSFASNTEVYCAVPENLERGAGMFPELADKTKDNLYRINLTTGVKELIAVPAGTYNISQILVSSANHALYFTDKKTNQLYTIKLP